MTVSLLTGPAWAGPTVSKPSPVQKTPSVRGKNLKPSTKKATAKAETWKPGAVTWPAAGSAEVALPIAAPLAKAKSPALVRAGSLPVRIAPPASAAWAAGAGSTAAGKGAQAGPSRVRVTVADHKSTQRAGITGLLMSVQRTDGSAAAATTQVEFDYAKIKDAYGATWSSSLRLSQVPACALTTPSKAECLQRTPLASRNDEKSSTLSASVDLPATSATSALLKSGTLAAPVGGTAVLLVDPSPDSSEGSFKATSLSSSGSWSAGGNSGSFAWNIPITVPPTPGGLAPKVGLNYSSSSVDGRTGTSNNQTSWVGEGWEYSPGFIERKYASCENDKQDGNNSDIKSGDLCWKSENATMSLNGSSSELVWDAGKGEWRLSNDDGSRVERIYDSPGNGSGDEDSEYWRVTTTDGTQYWFGKNRLPGWTTGDEETKSVNTVTVFGNHTGEQGHETDFASSSEIQGWRWNLDYVVDPHNNAMALYYIKYGGYYAKNGKIDTPVIYTRDSVLKKISYGLRAGQVYTPALAPAQVNFTVTNRCSVATCTLDEDHAKDWPDVPVYLDCKAATQCLQGSPSFWSTKRLISIDTVALSGGVHVPVDTWALNQSYPPTGDTSKPALWLASVTHTGKAGALGDSTPLTTTFTYSDLMANRVDSADGRPPINKRRIKLVTGETGSDTLVTYTDKDCTPTSLPSADDTNTRRCYPSWWTRDGGQDPVKDYFHKYLVLNVQESDTTAGEKSSPKNTKYVYIGGATWARDEGEFTLDTERTWNDFRGYRTVRTLTGTAPNRLRTDTDYYLGTGATINGVTDRRDFAGMASETRTLDGEAGPVVEKATHIPWVSPANATQAVVGITDPKTPKVLGPTLASKVARYTGTATTVASRLLADDTWQTSTTTRKYGTYGLLLTEGNDGASTTEATCKVTEYVTPDTENWLIAYPRQVTSTTATPCTTTISVPAVTGAGRMSYDGQAVGTAPKPGLANVTKTEQASKLDANGQLVWETQSQGTHDLYGRILTATGQDGETATTAYTPATGAQPTSISITNPKGHKTTSTFDGLRGLTLTSTDANNRTTTSQYDALGRLVKGWAAGRSTSEQPNVTYTYKLSATAPSTVTTKKLYEDGTWGTSVAFYDSLLRPVQTQTESIGITSTVGRIVTDTFYDAYGRVQRTNAPYYNENPVSTAPFDPIADDIPSASETLYDNRSRVTATVELHHNNETWRTTTTYGPNWQAVVPPKGGTATLAVSDARGRVIERRDYKDRTPGIGDAATLYEKHTYAFDRAGKLAKVADNSGHNTWTYSYDLAGRQTESTDPDKGKSTTVYGTDGRLQSSTDARGITLATTYDELGRKTSLRKGTVTGTKLAEWTYDTATGGKGLPATTTRYDGTAAYTSTVIGYNASGQATGTKVTVPSVTGEEELAGTYTVTGTATPVSGLPETTSYSTSNAKATTALPAETLTNLYGKQDKLMRVYGSLEQVYLLGAIYTPYGELQSAELGTPGTTVTSLLTYDQHTRQVALSDTRRDASPSILSSIAYTYDPAGNVTRITDQQENAAVEDDQCFTYDWARRLTEAWTSGDNCTTKPVNGAGTPNLGTVDPYWTSWTFTDTGQRATEKQHKAGPVTADTLRTHTYPTGTTTGHELQKVTATGGTTGTDAYAYDATGNMTIKNPAVGGTQTMAWNDEGRLASSTVSGNVTSFLYDTAGNRILKREPTTTTLYLPGGQELILTKATNTVTGNRYYAFPGGSAIRSSSDGRVRFLISDHHGTNTLSISATTGSYNRRKTLPYGAQRGATPAFWPGQKGFVGGDTDSTTDFTHIGAREYDPTTGQFISVDPLLSLDLPQSLNGYNYANNNPTTFSDPTGMRPDGVCGGNSSTCTPSDSHSGASVNYHESWQYAGKSGWNWTSWIVTKKEIARKYENYTSVTWTYLTEARKLNLNTTTLAGAIRYGVTSSASTAGTLLFGAAGSAVEDAYADGYDWLAGQAGINTSDPDYEEGFLLAAGASLILGGASAVSGDVKLGLKGLCHSFLPGTEVSLADGSSKDIEDIEVGDEVLATDPETGKTYGKAVLDTIRTEDDKDFTDVTVATPEGPSSIIATDTHPFWVPNLDRWVDAGNLNVGDTLRTASGTHVKILELKRFTKRQRTHDLTVADIHTYYVLAGKTPVLVHNCGNASVDELAEAATGPYKKAKIDTRTGKIARGQSNAGRALQKHADPSRGPVHASKFPTLASDAERTEMGDDMVLELLTNPGSVDTLGSASAHYGGTVRDIWHPSGSYGARWSTRGGVLTFEGFLG